MAAWREHKHVCGAAAITDRAGSETESHAEATLRRLVAFYLPTADFQFMARGEMADSHVLWLDAHSSPCTLSLLRLPQARRRLLTREMATAWNDTALLQQIPAALAVLDAFDEASSYSGPPGSSMDVSLAAFERVRTPAIMCTPVSVVCVPDVGSMHALWMVLSHFEDTLTDAERPAFLTALDAEAAELRAVATGGL